VTVGCREFFRAAGSAAEIAVDNRAIFQYQIHRCLSTLLRLFIPFSLRFLRRRVDPLIALVSRSGVLL
jgi:hypothetical protein